MNKNLIKLLESYPNDDVGIGGIIRWATKMSLYIPELIYMAKNNGNEHEVQKN